MTMMNQNAITEAHQCYCALTGLDLPYNENSMGSDWFLFLKQFDTEDLTLVVRHLRYRYKSKPEILEAMLRFRHLIRSLDYFAEYLAEAKAIQRAREYRGRISEGKRQVLQVTHRLPDEEGEVVTAKPVGELIAELKRSVGMEA